MVRPTTLIMKFSHAGEPTRVTPVDDEDDDTPFNLAEVQAARMIQRAWRRRLEFCRLLAFDDVIIAAQHKRKIKKGIREIFVYFFFIFFQTWWLNNEYYGSDNFRMADHITNQFAGVEMAEHHSPTWGKTFKDVATVQELYQWMHGVFVPVAYSSGTFDGDPNFTSQERGYLLGYGKVLGGIRVGTIRVKPRD
jgi:hypothetical protein